MALIKKELNTFTLNKENPKIEFKLSSKDSYLLIKSVSVTSKDIFNNKWANFISTVKLTAELKYIVYVNQERRFIDERKKQFPINILPNLFQVQPVSNLNQLIKNETFTLGWNPEEKFYETMILELHDIKEHDDNYSLQFDVELFKINKESTYC